MAAARARAELVAMVAHDLRGPLTATMLMAESLREDVTEPRLREACRQILANQQRISRVIDALGVDMADEQGQAALTPQGEALELLVEAISAEHLPAAGAKGQHLQLHARPVRLPVDAGRLFHAVANLIDNAIKYSPPGASLQVVVGPDDDGDGARIEVHDGGPGVDPLRAGALFQPYTRGEARPTGGERSTGLGLYIARRMVELHGGHLGVEPSRRTTGACFWIHLPRSSRWVGAQSQASQDRTPPPSTPTKREP
jgi:signal transduction histidine kinase